MTQCTALLPVSETCMIDKHYDILAVSVVNIGGELPGLTLANGRERSQAETLLIALWKNMMLSHSCRRVVC